MIKLLSWNINGLRAAEKKGFWDKIELLSTDIICLQEIKAKPEQLSDKMLNPEGWYSYFNPADRAGYSGVAVYSRIKPQAVYYGMGVPRFDVEGRVLVLDFPQFSLVNVYFPNGGRDEERLQFKLDFCEAMQKFLVELNRPIVLCGDVNTAHQERDLARPKANVKNSGFMPIERAWVDRFLDAGFVDSFRLFCQDNGRYSWWDMKSKARDRNVGWRIDYFFTSLDLKPKIQSADILSEVLGSDHCPVSLELSF